MTSPTGELHEMPGALCLRSRSIPTAWIGIETIFALAYLTAEEIAAKN